MKFCNKTWYKMYKISLYMLCLIMEAWYIPFMMDTTFLCYDVVLYVESK
jgi:hypothetical protein